MKNIIIAAALLLSTSASMAAERGLFQCVSDRLQAYNSSIYYNMSKDEIIDILDDSSHAFHSTVVHFTKSCLDNPN